jgi:hypothetical protein
MSKSLLIFVFFVSVFTPQASAAPADLGLRQPYETVSEQYLVIQQKLASDVFDGIPAAALIIQKTIAADDQKTFSPDFAKAVDSLVASTDLPSARDAFKAVSTELVVAFKLARITTGTLHEVYCPKASGCWIQTDGTASHNPYFGKALESCGDRVADF